jgi:hypothetical protein
VVCETFTSVIYQSLICFAPANYALNTVRSQGCGEALLGSLPSTGEGGVGGEHPHHRDAQLLPPIHTFPTRGEGELCLLTNRVPNKIAYPLQWRCG